MFSKSSKTEHPVAIPTFSPDAEIVATLETSLGNIVCRLHAKQCPKTVGNFVGLATGKTPWKNRKGEEQQGPLYDNTIFHRVIPDFMVQAGDPDGTGMGGPGYKFGDEFVSTLRHDKPGILSMANAGPNTNGSQFFITQRPTTWLDGKHTVFGEVTQGMDVVEAILAVDRNSSDKPLQDVVLRRISIAGLEG